MEEALRVLEKVFGYTSFKGGQAGVVESILQKKDTLAIMPTGAGKSVCYQLPALIYDGVTLVVSPLIALMKDQVDALKALGIPAAFINSSLKYSELRERLSDAKKGRYKLIYVAPERLEADGFAQLAEDLRISLIAVDEAHCVSQWGHDFRPTYKRIAPFISSLGRRPVVAAFTATATPEVKEDIMGLLGLQEPRVFVSGFDRENLYFSVLRGENKQQFILNYLASHPNDSGIIYAATRKDVDALYELLKKNKIRCGRYHAGMSKTERDETQDAFLRDDLPVMAATNAFGMGIDKSNVRFVIHHNLPKNMEAYYQEAGRAGRDGEPGECVLLYGAQDILVQKYMIEQTVLSPRRKIREFNKLQIVADYCHTSRCLRQYILEYFGEITTNTHCGNCVNCLDDRQKINVTSQALMTLSCVVRMRGRFGAVTVAEVLKGSQNKRIIQAGLGRLSTYGLLSSWTLQEIKDFIGFLTAEGYLALTEGKYPLLTPGPRAAAVIRQGEEVWRREMKAQSRKADDSLFAALRRTRKEIADRENIPPYIVFSDATLREMSICVPADETALAGIKGVGEIKLKRYGAEFLQTIMEHSR